MKVVGSGKHTRPFNLASHPVSLPSGFQVVTNLGKTTFTHQSCSLGYVLFSEYQISHAANKTMKSSKIKHLSEQYLTECRNCIQHPLSFPSCFPLESSNALLEMDVSIPTHYSRKKTVTPIFLEQKTVQPENTLPGFAFSAPEQTEMRSVDTVSTAKITSPFRCLSNGFEGATTPAT